MAEVLSHELCSCSEYALGQRLRSSKVMFSFKANGMEKGEQPTAQRMSACTCTQAGNNGLGALHGEQD